MKIAIAGYGMMGTIHIASLRTIGHKVDMILGRDPERTKRFALENGIGFWSTDPEDLIKNGIDVLHVCTPPHTHYSLVKFALENGIHVICEKPFVFDAVEGEEVTTLAEQKGLINAVGFNVRFHSACQDMHSLIKSGEIGDVLLISGSYMQEFHALPSLLTWRYDDKNSGGFLATTEIGSHWIDLMRFLSGKEVSAVSATYGSFFQDRVIKGGIQYPANAMEGEPFHTDLDNTAIVTFHLTDGSLANMVLSEITPGRYNYLEMTVTGSSKSIWWNSEDINRFHVGSKNNPVGEHVLAFGDGFNASVTKMLAEIYDDISRGEISEYSSYATFRDGLINAKVCNAIYHSAHNNSVWGKIE